MSTTDSRLWDLYALCYDAVNQSPPYRRLLSSVIAKLDLKPGQKLLDAGCGTGNLEVLISDLGLENIKIEAVDSNQGMLDRALKKGVGAKTNFRLADLNQKLAFSDNFFDRMVAIHVLYALKDPQAALYEFFRVLKPDGLLVLANPHDKSKSSEIMKANLEGLNIFEKVWLLLTKLPLIVINLIICRSARSGKFHFLGEKHLKDMLEKAGFADVSIKLAYAGQDLLVCARKRTSRLVRKVRMNR